MINFIQASMILKEGTIVTTKIEHVNEWNSNIICKCEENTFYIYLLERYVVNLILEKTNIIVKNSNQFFEYMITGEIVEIQTTPPGLLKINILKIEELVNLREFPRYDINIPLSLCHSVSESPAFAMTTNISQTGMAFVSKHDYEYGQDIKVVLHLPNSSNVNVIGKVIRKIPRPKYIEASMVFTDMDEKNSNTLYDYIVSSENIARVVRPYFVTSIL